MGGKNRIVYSGKVFKVGVRSLRFPGGNVLEYGTVLTGKVAAIIPVLDDGRILLEYNYRNTVNKWVYELPAGHVDKGESPKACAARELEEETGYKASRLMLLFKGFASPGITDEEMHLFFGTGLTKGTMNREPSERIRLRPMPLSKVLDLVKENRGVDIKTALGILIYKNYLEEGRRD